jgi:hypothetical protein
VLSNSLKFITTKWYTSLALLVLTGLTMAFSAEANTVSVTFLGADTGVNNGTDFVLPYQLSLDGITTDAACYDIFDAVSPGQSWVANVWTTPQAILEGQFSGALNAAAGYDEIAFLSQQATSSPQNQIDLQEDIWNVFGGNQFPVAAGMQSYLDLLNTPAYSSFNFGSVEFLEDSDQAAGRAQAFVVSSSAPGLSIASAPEPGTMTLLAGGLLLLCVKAFRFSRVGARQ